MTGPLTDAIFPTTADLLSAAWTGWWREHKLPPSPDQLLTHANGAFWEWRAEVMQRHRAYLADRLGDRLLPLYDLVSDLVLERVDCRGWEFPDPETEPDDVISSWIASLGHLMWPRDCMGADLPALDPGLRSARSARSDLRRGQRIPAGSEATTAAQTGNTCTCRCADRCRRRCHSRETQVSTAQTKPNRSLAPARPILKSRPTPEGPDGQEL